MKRAALLGAVKRPVLLGATLLALGLPSSAAPFVFPNAWSVSPTGAGEARGTLRDGSVTEPRTFNPLLDTGVPQSGGLVGARGLFVVDPVTSDVLPYMAQSYVLSENKLRWTVRLRPGMRWSDGQAITSQDWVLSARLHSDRALSTNQRDRFLVEGRPVQVSAEGDDTVVFTFPKVVANAIDTLSVPPLPAHVFARAFETGGAAGVRALWGTGERPANIVTAGAFKLANFEPGVRAVYVRNPYFAEWNASADGETLPHLERVEQRFFQSRAGLVDEFLNGRLDVFATTNPLEVERVKAAFDAGSLRGTLRLNAVSSGSTTWLTFNWNKASDPFKQALFRNPSFRQAISHLIDRDRIVTEVYGGLAKAQYGALTDAFGEWVAEDAPAFKFDPVQAGTLLAQLGFRNRNADGVLLNRDNRALEFEVFIANASPEAARVMEIIQADALRAGVSVRVTPLPQSTLVGALTASGDDRPWDAVYSTAAFNTPSTFPLNGAYYACTGRLHFFNTSGTCLDPLETQGMQLYERARQTLDLTQRKQIVKEAQSVTARLQAVIHVTAPTAHHAWLERVRGELTQNAGTDVTRWLELTWLGR